MTNRNSSTTSRSRYRLRRYPQRKGASATELAIILPLFITIVLGCVDFGRFAYTYIAVSNAARAGAAWAMTNKPANMAAPTATWQNQISTAVSNEMSLQPGFQANNVTVGTVTPVLNADGSTYGFTVTVSYPFTTIVNWNVSGYGIPSSITLTQQVTMRFIR
ncbi:MAG TPA: TadE/TadG family type IV pilus assembly protein [Isosphaeraceae bacterium]|nr:TadE/TadG family type IV pilus assembly protein [Isosphaeraceae bacterium]